MARTQAWRNRLTENCITIARAATGEHNVVATVQRMLADHEHRAHLTREALRRTSPSDKETVKLYQQVQKAADALRQYEGRTV